VLSTLNWRFLLASHRPDDEGQLHFESQSTSLVFGEWRVWSEQPGRSRPQPDIDFPKRARP
jgi:hypothetical protein